MSQNELLSPITRTPEQKLEQYTNISSEQLSELKGNLIYRLVGDMSKEQLVQFTYVKSWEHRVLENCRVHNVTGNPSDLANMARSGHGTKVTTG